MDSYSGYSSVKEGVKVLKDVPKLQNLKSTYYEAGNIMDGFQRMNNLKLWTDGSSGAAKAFGGIKAGVNFASIYYNSKDLKYKFGN